MSTEWHYARNGNQYGPFTAEEFRKLAANRVLRPDDLVWREGMREWKPAHLINGLFPSVAPQPTKAADDKYCHECGAVIRQKAELCPFCGVRQQVNEPNVKNGRGGLTTPVLISAIANIIFVYFSDANRQPLATAVRQAGVLSLFEIIVGLFNLVSLICGIILLVNRGKYLRTEGHDLDNNTPSVITTLIPSGNPPALAAYYCGVFSVIPLCFIGWAAVILGIIGLRHEQRTPEVKGGAHAWVGIIVGGVFGVLWTAVTIFLLIMWLTH